MTDDELNNMMAKLHLAAQLEAYKHTEFFLKTHIIGLQMFFIAMVSGGMLVAVTGHVEGPALLSDHCIDHMMMAISRQLLQAGLQVYQIRPVPYDVFRRLSDKFGSPSDNPDD